MKSRRNALAVLILLLGPGGGRTTLRAQQPQPPPFLAEATVETDRRILAEIKDHNEIMANLEYLSDMIGARLTGTDNMNKASRWTQERFNSYGLANVHLEPWTIARAWYRGPARGRIVSPVEHPLTIRSFGWSPGTRGVVRAPVVYLKAKTVEELERYKGKLKNAIVITSEPEPLPLPGTPPANPMLVPYGDAFLMVYPRAQRGPAIPLGPAYRKLLEARNELLKSEGVAAVLVDSHKPGGLLNMAGSGGHDYAVGPMPEAFVTSENYSLIWRLMQRGPVEVELELTNTFSDKPVEVYNTVAEIRGSEKPDEVVILGAHLDSWDLGTGTTDNGTGSMVVLEAARALQKLDLKPKRTIRFILFSGEEQGLNGSRAYVEAHKNELAKISAVLVHDTGTGRVISIGLMGNYQDREVMDRVVAPLHELGLLELSERSMGGSDHASFNAAGVPGFYGIQEPAQYFETHHSQADTFDAAHEGDLVEGAQVLAVWAYNVAQLLDRLPRKPAAEKSGASSH